MSAAAKPFLAAHAPVCRVFSLLREPARGEFQLARVPWAAGWFGPMARHSFEVAPEPDVSGTGVNALFSQVAQI